MEYDEDGQAWMGVEDVAALADVRKQTVWVMLYHARERWVEDASRPLDLPLPERTVKRPVKRRALRPAGPCAHCDQTIHEEPGSVDDDSGWRQLRMDVGLNGSGLLVHDDTGVQECQGGLTIAAGKPYSPVAQWTPQWREKTIRDWWARRQDPEMRRLSQARPRDPGTGRFVSEEREQAS